MAVSWYVVRVQSGREESVRQRIVQRVGTTQGMDQFIKQVVVPVESITEIKGGQKKIRERKMYPGYLMVQMELTPEAWYLIKETNGVGDFVGPYSSPIPMADAEADRILADMNKTADEAPKLKIDFNIGDSVKIKEGPFENFDGVVEEVYPQKGLVKVTISIFGRATPVELEYWQVEAI